MSVEPTVPRCLAPGVAARWVAAILASGLLLTSCGGGGDDAAAPTATVTVTATVTAEGAPPESSETTPADEPSSEDETASTTAGDVPSFENGVLTTDELRIEILRYKVIKAGEKGNEYGEKPVIAFWYKTTNLGGTDVSPMDFIFHFTAYQDNNPDAVNELDVGSLPDDQFLDSQTEDIKQGGTVENAVAYELDDLTTPVDLAAIEGLDDVLGTVTYQLT